jgi:hypothetical protein
MIAMLACWVVLAAGDGEKAAMNSGLPEMTVDEVWDKTRLLPYRPDRVLSENRFNSLVEHTEAVLGAVRANDWEAAAKLGQALAPFHLRAIRVLLARGSALAFVDLQGSAGGYLFRMGKVEMELILQAPHRFFDEGTGTIARFGFERVAIRGMYFNTAHRYAASQGRAVKSSASDVAHDPRSHFSALTLAAAHAFSMPTFVQLHGFSADSTAAEIGAVVSAGQSGNAGAARRVVELLATIGIVARFYPDDVKVLGGTENVQGRILSGQPARFVHLEMCPALRERLARSDEAGSFVEALVAQLKRPQP